MGRCLNVKDEEVARSLVMVGMLGFVVFVENGNKNFSLCIYCFYYTCKEVSNSQLFISIMYDF